MEVPQGESLLALGAGPLTHEARLPPFPFFRQENQAEAIRTEGMAFTILPHGVETEGRFSLAATAATLGDSIFHDSINMKSPDPGRQRCDRRVDGLSIISVSLYRHRFCQVTRLVNRTAAQAGHMIR